MIAGATGDTAHCPASPPRWNAAMRLRRRDILSSENEERLVKREMREEIVRQILNRLKVLPAQGQVPQAQHQAAEIAR